jgi:hypothetical protein
VAGTISNFVQNVFWSSSATISTSALESLLFMQTGVSEVTTAGDWGDRFEFELTDGLMLAVKPKRLQVFRTTNPT